MRISEIVDKVIVMNLERRTDRLKHCKEQAKKFNFQFDTFISTDALLINEGDIPKHLRPGEYGLILTYLNVLNHCIASDLDSVLIMEDDFEFCYGLENRIDEISEIPEDWDLIYLGANHFHLGAGAIPPIKISENVLKLKSSFCAHAIIFKKHMILELKNKLSDTGNLLPVDVALSEIQQSFNCYGFIKNLCKQFDSHSDI